MNRLSQNRSAGSDFCISSITLPNYYNLSSILKSATPVFKKYFFLLLSVVLAVAIFYKFHDQFDWNGAWTSILHANVVSLIIGALFFLFKIMNDSYRWYRLTAVFNIPVPYINLLRYNVESTAFDFVTPLPQAEEFYRFARLSFYTDKLTAAAVVVCMRVAGSLALLFTLPVAIYHIPGVSERLGHFNGRWIPILTILSLFLALLLLYWKWRHYYLPVFLGKYAVRFKQIRESVINKKSTLAESFLLALLSQVIYAISIYFLSKSLMADVSFFDCFCIIPLIFVATFIPISIAGLGVREAVIVWTLQRLGVPLAVALSVALLHFAILAAYIGLGGLIFLKDALRVKQHVHAEER